MTSIMRITAAVVAAAIVSCVQAAETACPHADVSGLTFVPGFVVVKNTQQPGVWGVSAPTRYLTTEMIWPDEKRMRDFDRTVSDIDIATFELRVNYYPPHFGLGIIEANSNLPYSYGIALIGLDGSRSIAIGTTRPRLLEPQRSYTTTTQLDFDPRDVGRGEFTADAVRGELLHNLSVIHTSCPNGLCVAHCSNNNYKVIVPRGWTTSEDGRGCVMASYGYYAAWMESRRWIPRLNPPVTKGFAPTSLKQVLHEDWTRPSVAKCAW